MNDKVIDKNRTTDEAPDLNKRKLITHGGIAAGGLAAFAAGYGETVFKAGKGLITGSAGDAPAHATSAPTKDATIAALNAALKLNFNAACTRASLIARNQP